MLCRGFYAEVSMRRFINKGKLVFFDYNQEMNEYYKTLGVKRTASKKDIENQYEILQKRFKKKPKKLEELSKAYDQIQKERKSHKDFDTKKKNTKKKNTKKGKNTVRFEDLDSSSNIAVASESVNGTETDSVTGSVTGSVTESFLNDSAKAANKDGIEVHLSRRKYQNGKQIVGEDRIYRDGELVYKNDKDLPAPEAPALEFPSLEFPSLEVPALEDLWRMHSDNEWFRLILI